MKKQIAILIVAMLLMMMLPSSSEAFWWLFGRTQDEVYLSYLYINDIPFDESGESITLYRDFMPDDLAHIRGRAVVGKGQIGSVMVSLDGMETWREARLSDNGAFEFSFRPQLGRTYEVYVEAMETAGRTNDVDETFKIVTVSDLDIRSRMSDTLDRLFTAYMSHSARAFMELVSPSFTGDDLLLEKAVLNDFRFFDDIWITYSIVSVSTDAEGNAFALISYDRSVVAASDGETHSDSGVTGFSFSSEDGELKVYSMMHPVIFGVSGASEIASGLVSSAQNDEVLVVDDSGDVTLGPPDEDGLGGGTGGDGGIEVETITLTTWFHYDPEGYYTHSVHQGYRFSDATVVSSSQFFEDVDFDFANETNLVFFDSMVGVQDLGLSSIDGITEVPLTGYEYDSWDWVQVGHCYALHLPGDTYAVLRKAGDARFYDADDNEVSEMDDDARYAATTFEYKYRSDGSRQF